MDALPVGCVNVALAQIMGYTHQKYTPPLTPLLYPTVL